MMGPRIEVRAEMDGQQLIEALRRLILNDESFRPEAWSLDDAETLVRCAAAIREGNLAAGSAVLSLAEARLRRCCRICGGPDDPPLTLNFGREYAHTACLERINRVREGS